ncbi:MAG: alanine/glycine:cation symporter family protein [Parvularculaceae bacterium]
MLETINNFLWSKILVFILLPIGLWFTIGSGFVQFRYFGRMFSILGGAFHHEGDKPTSFQALALSVAGRVGAGNIAGVAVAITLGGPGAIFWMWVVGILGMATSFFECTLAQAFKRLEHTGEYRGGPAFYIVHGLKTKLGALAPLLAGLFSILLLITFGFAFNVVQSYAVSTSVAGAFSIPPAATGVALAIVIGLIIFGGVKRIVRVVEFVVPVMAISYIAVALFVLGTHLSALPGVIALIVKSAFGFNAAIGGGVGAAMTYGVQRGLFSNEAGLGSAPNVAAVAYVPHPANQGAVQSLSVFIDTIVICTCTAAIILLSGVAADPNVDGVILTQTALAAEVGGWANQFVAGALMLFVVSSIMYNYYLGENALDFFVRENKQAIAIFRVLTLAFVLLGSVMNLGSAFGFANLTMGALALVNLFALALLFPAARRLLADFDRQRKEGGEPVFDPDAFPDLDIDREAWRLLPEDQKKLDARRAAP